MSHPDPHDPDVTVVASVSGGKDSTALSLWLTDHGIEHKRVHADTGWEHKETEAYVREYLPTVLGPIDIVQGEHQMVSLIRKKGMFPGRINRFCTLELKVKPIAVYVNALDTEVVNVVGIRAAESRSRAKMSEWEYEDRSFDCWVWRPLITWSEEDVFAIHRRHGVKPNPLYLKGANRVGCWPCIFSRKKEVKLVADISPERIDLIRELEAEVQEKARVRYEKKGETFESLGYMLPTFFSRSGNKMTTGIDDYVLWSRTARGGRQFELFEDEIDDGCMRWGLCDTEGEE